MTNSGKSPTGILKRGSRQFSLNKQFDRSDLRNQLRVEHKRMRGVRKSLGGISRLYRK